MDQIDTRLASWGIEIAFIRTKVGEEFPIIDSLIAKNTIADATYFTTYGHFDLAAIRPIASLNSPYAVVLHRHIYESAPFRFFANFETSREQFQELLASAPAVVAIMAKIHPLVIHGLGGSARWMIADRLKEKLPSAFIFFGLGFSEILLIDGGGSFDQFLETVREMRSLSGGPDIDSPALAKTTTFPFVSYNVIHKNQRYDLLAGDVEPVITISCQPASERAMADAIRSAGIISKHIWGKNDLLLTWPKPIKFAELAKFVFDFRGDPKLSNVLARTTTYLETPVHEPPAGHNHASVAIYEVMDDEEEQKLFAALGQVKPHSLRASLSDLALRLCACARSPLLTGYYRDMVNTLEYVANLLTQVNSVDNALSRGAGVQASRVADAARSAINQRYAGLELHPETLAHSPSPLLCDIRTIVAAATCLPHYLFSKLFEDRDAGKVWPGFVLFGGAYSPQWLDQDVLALPASSILTPIEEWWRVTHEAAHAVFRLTELDQMLPSHWHRHLDASTKNELNSLQMLGEQFANWFDWRYVFRCDTEFYLQTIWRAWLNVPMVWQSKPQYFARSFGVLLSNDAEVMAAVLKQPKHQGAIPFLEKRWSTFEEFTKPNPLMRQFLEEARQTEGVIPRTFELTYGLYPIVQWFESEFEARCGVGGLRDRIAPEYLQIDKHVEELRAGKVILTDIHDPPRLHLALLKALDGAPPSLATEIAYLYSFENAYLMNRTSADAHSALQH